MVTWTYHIHSHKNSLLTYTQLHLRRAGNGKHLNFEALINKSSVGIRLNIVTRWKAFHEFHCTTHFFHILFLSFLFHCTNTFPTARMMHCTWLNATISPSFTTTVRGLTQNTQDTFFYTTNETWLMFTTFFSFPRAAPQWIFCHRFNYGDMKIDVQTKSKMNRWTIRSL